MSEPVEFYCPKCRVHTLDDMAEYLGRELFHFLPELVQSYGLLSNMPTVEISFLGDGNKFDIEFLVKHHTHGLVLRCHDGWIIPAFNSPKTYIITEP